MQRNRAQLEGRAKVCHAALAERVLETGKEQAKAFSMVVCKLVLILSLVCTASGSMSGALAEVRTAEQFTIVSDVDDTLRVSHVENRWDLFLRFLFSNRAFSGMSEVLQSWYESDAATRFVYLTAAPAIVKPRVRQFLRSQYFPEGKIIGRDLSDPRSTAEYKYLRLERLLAATTERMILIGDNTQYDAEVYSTLFQNYPERVAEIYIRQIRDESLPDGVYPIVTSYDLARYEYSFGRFTISELNRVAERILKDPVNNRVIPDFQVCPELPVHKHFGSEVAELDARVAARVREICENRISQLEALAVH